jgi:polyvinyl alcohol dehydrogenase (cytochrome)
MPEAPARPRPRAWTSFGGDLAHTRSSPDETSISVENVAQLTTAFDIPAPGVTSTPVIMGGVVYWADWAGKVHATNLADQKAVWELDASAAGGGYTGSPMVTERFVYVANRNGRLSALDRALGTVVWEAKLDAGPATHIWSSPVVAEQDGVLVIGVASQGTTENAMPVPRSRLETFRGSVVGFDALTGKELWRIATSPEPNGAGVSVWSSAALDTQRKLAFIGTGQGYYKPVSPLSDSLLAIDYMTGKIRWSDQYYKNDAWTLEDPGDGIDADVSAAPNLFSVDGRDMVGVGDKNGVYHAHDRETGVEVWRYSYDAPAYSSGGIIAPAAYAEGTIYVITTTSMGGASVYALRAADGFKLWKYSLSYYNWGAPAVANGVLYVGDQSCEILALNSAAGNKLWSHQLPQGRAGGFSLCDGVLFTGYGFHHQEPNLEPLQGGLRAFSLKTAQP